MKIGILTSSNDMLSLFKFLHCSDHQYFVFYDDKFSFWGDKTTDLLMERIQEWIDFLYSKGVEVFIVPPIVELKISNENLFPNIKILPLFQNYVLKNCFAYSLVGKIGFLGDYFDLQEWQKQLENLSKNYNLSTNQVQIQKFNFPFAYRGKEVREWKYLLDKKNWSQPLVNHRVKGDIRYFKDATVDTLIPCNYSYFLLEKTIKKSIFHKMRFHGISALEKVFLDLNLSNSWEYFVSVFCTGHWDFLKREKKLIRQINRGNPQNLEIVCL